MENQRQTSDCGCYYGHLKAASQLIIHLALPEQMLLNTLYDANADSVYKRMLQPSDNFYCRTVAAGSFLNS